MINKNVEKIQFKNWHDNLKIYLADHFAKSYTVRTEATIRTPDGYKKSRRADILIPELKLVVEVQKSHAITKDFRERCDDYGSAGYGVLWVMNEDRWQPDTDGNPELQNESEDIIIKWRDYKPERNAPGQIYNSNRCGIIDHLHKRDHVDLLFCVTTGQSGLMYRKVEKATPVSRLLTPKFTSDKHFGAMHFNKNFNQPKEEFEGYIIHSSIIPRDTFNLQEFEQAS
jgi:hypothetical protein